MLFLIINNASLSEFFMENNIFHTITSDFITCDRRSKLLLETASFVGFISVGSDDENGVCKIKGFGMDMMRNTDFFTFWLNSYMKYLVQYGASPSVFWYPFIPRDCY